MRHASVTLPRMLLGAVFTVSGLNGIFHFMEYPPLPQAAEGFMEALAETGYFLPFLRLMELTGGLMLLSGRLIPLGLLILAPIILNIFLFHTFLAPGLMMGLAIMLALLELYLSFGYFHYFRGIFTMEAEPDSWDLSPDSGTLGNTGIR